jgi:hypothetical protein
MSSMRLFMLFPGEADSALGSPVWRHPVTDPAVDRHAHQVGDLDLRGLRRCGGQEDRPLESAGAGCLSLLRYVMYALHLLKP